MYARRVNGEVLEFGHRGWLYEDSFIFYDRKTDSLWVQATGAAVYGHYKGTRLKRLPATQTTWSQWRHIHPDTLVLSRPKGKTIEFWQDSYSGYYATGKGGNGVQHDHGGPLSFGLAVVLPQGQKLYPFVELEKTPLLADRVADQPVVIVFHAPSCTAVAFDPRKDGRILNFQRSQGEGILLQDRQTGSTWSGLTGRCLAGPARGFQLRQLTTTQFVVENWPFHYPKAPVYKAP